MLYLRYNLFYCIWSLFSETVSLHVGIRLVEMEYYPREAASASLHYAGYLQLQCPIFIFALQDRRSEFTLVLDMYQCAPTKLPISFVALKALHTSPKEFEVIISLVTVTGFSRRLQIARGRPMGRP
jgi:hypothetical protein